METIRHSVPKQIASHLEQEIKNGVYQVGDKLPTEPELVELYQASRNTVREAVQALIQAGLLQAKQGKGTYVVAKERLQVDFFQLMNEIQSSDIVEVRTFLETYIVEAAVVNHTAEDLNNLEMHLARRNQTFEEIKENTKADIAFHKAIALSTHNLLLYKLYEYIADFFYEFIASSVEANKENQDYINTLHCELVTAIQKKNVEAAKRIINQIINI